MGQVMTAPIPLYKLQTAALLWLVTRTLLEQGAMICTLLSLMQQARSNGEELLVVQEVISPIQLYKPQTAAMLWRDLPALLEQGTMICTLQSLTRAGLFSGAGL